MNNFKPGRYIRQAAALLGLLLLFLAVQWIVNAFRQPGHMDVLESQTMDMTVRPPTGAMPVRTEVVQLRAFVPTATYPANVAAYNDIPIYPRVEGRIVSMPVYSGDRVQAGQLLAQLDTDELSSRLAEARAGQTAAARQYDASRHQQSQASAQMAQARQALQKAQAELDYRHAAVGRSRALVAEDVITREEAQRDEADYAAALAETRQAEAALEAARQGVAASASQAGAQQAFSSQAAAAARTQGIIRSYARLTAPQSGVITQRMVAPGTLVSPGMPVFQLAQINPVRIQASVAESDWRQIQRGNLVRIQSSASSGMPTEHGAGTPSHHHVRPVTAPVTAKVTAIFPQADLQTRTAIVEAIVPNDDGQWIPGDFVTVDIQTGASQNSLTVPNSALTGHDERQAVWLMREGKAHRQLVTTSSTDGKRTAIINGLKAGDIVITQGDLKLAEGMSVIQGGNKTAKPAHSDRLTADNGYRLRRAVGMYLATVTLEKPPGQVGDNTFQIETVSGPGMDMPLDNISVDINAHMPAMPKMPVPKPTIHKMTKGRFHVQANLGMSGLWQLTVTVKNGSKTLGTFPVEIEVPQ